MTTSTFGTEHIPNGQLAGTFVHFDDPALHARYPAGVYFTLHGHPDFTPYARVAVSMPEPPEGMGVDEVRVTDILAANEAATAGGEPLFQQGRPPSATPEGWTWHHVENSRTLQLVPAELHAALRHHGGIATLQFDRGGRPGLWHSEQPPHVSFSRTGTVPEDVLRQLESHLGYPLPPPYRAFLGATNGGAPLKPAVNTDYGFIADQRFFGLYRDEPFEALTGANARLSDRFTTEYLAIAHVQGGMLLLKVLGEGSGSVWYWDDDDPRDEGRDPFGVCGGLLYPVGDNFNDFARRLVEVPPKMGEIAHSAVEHGFARISTDADKHGVLLPVELQPGKPPAEGPVTPVGAAPPPLAAVPQQPEPSGFNPPPSGRPLQAVPDLPLSGGPQPVPQPVPPQGGPVPLRQAPPVPQPFGAAGADDAQGYRSMDPAQSAPQPDGRFGVPAEQQPGPLGGQAPPPFPGPVGGQGAAGGPVGPSRRPLQQPDAARSMSETGLEQPFNPHPEQQPPYGQQQGGGQPYQQSQGYGGGEQRQGSFGGADFGQSSFGPPYGQPQEQQQPPPPPPAPQQGFGQQDFSGGQFSAPGFSGGQFSGGGGSPAPQQVPPQQVPPQQQGPYQAGPYQSGGSSPYGGGTPGGPGQSSPAVVPPPSGPGFPGGAGPGAVTRERAMAIADEWINSGMAPHEREEIQLHEFSLGYVVWGMRPGSGPEEQPAAMAVIDRQSGELTMWPSLAPEQVAAAYERKYHGESPYPSR